MTTHRLGDTSVAMVGGQRVRMTALFVTSIAVLALEIAQIRIFSYSLDPLLVFSAISVALLGLGAGAIAVTLRPHWLRQQTNERLTLCLSAFGVSTIVAHVLFARTSADVGFGSSAGILLRSLPLFSLSVVPYFFAGVFLSIILTERVREVSIIYAVNLAGSAIGCVILLPLLRPFGVEPLVALIAASTCWCAVWLAPTKRMRCLAIAIAVLCSVCIPVSRGLFPFQPDPGDLYGVALEALRKAHPNQATYEPKLELSRWDPVSRVEIFHFPGQFGRIDGRAPVRLLAQDGGAGSMLVDVRKHARIRRSLFEGTVYGAAYALRPKPERVLVIGLGGAPDVQAALHHGAKHVTAVEINRTILDLTRTTYSELLDGLGSDARVRLVHHDGRSFVERSTERWDVIQMTGADTYSAGSAGAFMFSESYLYTVEAFVRYYQALSDDGVLAVIRFGLEPLRVVTTARTALRSLGVEHPENHIVVIGQGIWINVMISRVALDHERSLRLASKLISWNGSSDPVRIPVYDAMGFGLHAQMALLYAPGHELPGLYSKLLNSPSKEERRLLAPLGMDFTPVTDDRPFFFQFFGVHQLPQLFSGAPDSFYARGLRSHFAFLVAIALAAGLLLLVPVVGRRENSEEPTQKAAFIYFGAIGLAYLLVELTIMQKSALLLGHPTYSVSATLLAMLLGSGLGSWWSGKHAEPHRLARKAAVAVALLLLTFQWLLADVFRAALPWPFAARVAILVLLVGVLGFAMGVPFPSGLRAIGENKRLVSWNLAVNSFASVVASLACVPIAMFAGFSAVMMASVALYLVAAAMAPRPEAG